MEKVHMIIDYPHLSTNRSSGPLSSGWQGHPVTLVERRRKRKMQRWTPAKCGAQKTWDTNKTWVGFYSFFI